MLKNIIIAFEHSTRFKRKVHKKIICGVFCENSSQKMTAKHKNIARATVNKLTKNVSQGKILIHI